jgi:nifR3 family TIM-barrel protein
MPNAPELQPQHRPELTPPPGPQTYVQPFLIGPVRIERPFVLAPMSGVTDSAFRRLVQTASGGAVGLLVTEFISIEGLTRNNLRTAMRMAYVAAEEFPLSVQIFGGDIPRMVDAARMAEEHGAQIVDINCGCPAPKVVRRGGGAELLRRGPHLAQMVEQTVAAVRIPVTVKIRSGWSADSINATEIASACVEAGAQSVAVHGRTRLQLYTGEADWSVVDAVAKAVQVPVVGSGDVTTPEEALWRLRTTQAAGVMIGRAAIMNPWIFGQIDDLVQGLPKREITSADRLRVLKHYRDMASERIPDHAMPGRIKQLLARMTKGFQYGSLLREKAMRAHTTPEMFEHIERFFAAVDAGTVEQWAAEIRGAGGVAAAVQLDAAEGEQQTLDLPATDPAAACFA